MDFMTAMDISASGLSAERTNMNIISMNLANAQTTRTPEGGPYQRRRVVFRAVPVEMPFEKAVQSALDRDVKGVKVARVEKDGRPFKQVHEPDHPDAGQDGYVLYPDINVMEEMANMLTATRAYEANLSSLSTIKTMLSQALQIGR